MRMKLSDLARLTGGTPIGGDREFSGVATDSRKVKPGQLFVALKGERADGHSFVAEAFAKGASGALVERAVPGLEAGVIVEDTYSALREMVRWARKSFGGQVVAVLGAVGKTTTKEMLLQVLRGQFRVAGPVKSFNNLVGVALTVLNTTGEEDVWVLELGTNRKGEIGELASLTLPDHIVYTKLGPEHLEGLGSTYGAIEEEFSALRYASGFVLVPDDSPRFPERPHYRYGFKEGSHFRGESLSLSEDGVSFTFEGRRFWVPYPHVGFAHNALAAVSFAKLFGIPLEDVAQALRAFRGQPMRMEIIHLGNLTVINDAYNSNPISLEGLLRSISLLYPDRRVAFAFGDMLELGEESEYWHRWAGRKMCKYGVAEVVGYGEWSRFVVEEAKACGVRGRTASTYREIARYLYEAGYEVIAVKGSRGMEMERVVEALIRLSRSDGSA